MARIARFPPIQPMKSTQKKSGHDGRSRWYAEGLRFECTRCGRCCTGEPGYVWVEKEEIARIAEFLKMSQKEFRKRFCRRVITRISLLERPNGDCVFFHPNGCRVYPVRPLQCRTFPFWDHLLKKPARWEEMKKKCPGMGHGHLYSPREIERIRNGEENATRS